MSDEQYVTYQRRVDESSPNRFYSQVLMPTAMTPMPSTVTELERRCEAAPCVTPGMTRPGVTRGGVLFWRCSWLCAVAGADLDPLSLTPVPIMQRPTRG
jgi:hypothetical protein